MVDQVRSPTPGMVTTFALPDLGEGLQEAEIVAWHVAEGDHVVADQPLVSVETDKAVVEIPSPRSGRIAKLLAPLHARLAVGAPLVTFATQPDADVGTVVGDLPERPAAPATPRPPPSPAAPHPRAAPSVRALAASLGIDLATVAGTGPDGTITAADVRRMAPSGAADTLTPLTGVRRAMALRMAEAGAAVVPATVTDEADVEAWNPADRPTVRLVMALVAACRHEPSLNASFDGQRLARSVNTAVHVGLAVDTEDGLIVPVLRNAEGMESAAIEAAVSRLEDAARRRALSPDMLRGPTITLSNFGTIGGRFANLVVVPPQVAILGAGRIARRSVVRGDAVVARRVLPLSLTFDHRAVSGGEAARFLAAVKHDLERGEPE